MNQTQAAAEIAKRINASPDFRAKVRFVGGSVVVSCEKDSGGKRGWIGAGEIMVGSTINVSKETEFAFRYDKFVLAEAVSVEYLFEAPGEPESETVDLAEVARKFRSGKPVDPDKVVECVTAGYLTQQEAMTY